MHKRSALMFAIVICVGLISASPSRAATLSDTLKGRILLQVESKGEAWYVNPKDGKRYYMPDGSAAYIMMRNLGVGITNKNLDKVKTDKNFAKKQQGKIFLQVESKGEAYYIDTKGEMHYLKDGEAAYGVMRELGLGIKNTDIDKIDLSDKDKDTKTSVTGLQIVVKDFGMPDVRYLKPNIKEIQLKNEMGKWVTIWSKSEGQEVNLTPDGAETALDTVDVPAGTYNGTRLFVTTMGVGVDVNRDGDILDKNVQTIITEEEFNLLPKKEKPSAPSKSSGDKPSGSDGDKPSKPQKPSGDMNSSALSVSSTDQDGGDKQQKSSKPSKPSEPSEPSAPYTIKDGYVYMPEFQDEEHIDTVNKYFVPQMPNTFVYDGAGGIIVYDFTLHPLLPRGQHISIEVSSSP